MKKYLFSIFLILGIFNICYADRVCIEKSTGKLIEYQSGNAPLGILTKNAISAGYKKEDIEEKYVTKEEWEVIKKEWIDNPVKKITEEEEKIRNEKKELIKQRLNLTEVEWNDLEIAIGAKK